MGKGKKKPYPVTFAIKTSYCVKHVSSIAIMSTTFMGEKNTKDIPAVCKFADVSPAELSERPPQREIGYEINELLKLNSFSWPPIL